MDRTAVLNEHVTNMAAVATHIRDAVKGQVASADAAKYPEAHRVLARVHAAFDRHVTALEGFNDATEGGSVREAVKDVVGAVTGAAAGLYNQIRTDDKVSRMVRDTYTATGLACISYTMLHTTALGLKEPGLAALALAHLKDLTPLVGEMSEAVCHVVASELADEGEILDPSVAPTAVHNTQQAWSREEMDKASV